QATAEERPAPASLANITDEGQRIPRQTSQMRRQSEQHPAETGPAPDVMPAAPAAAIAAAAPDAQQQRVSPTLTQVLVDLSHPQPGSRQQRVLYSVQATRDSAWAVFAPGHPEPLAIRPSREQAETWALQLARTGTPPTTPAHRTDTTTAHHGDDEPTTPPAPPALAPSRREPAPGPDQDDIHAPEPGSAPQPEDPEPQADDPAGPPTRPDSAPGPDDLPALDAAPAPGPQADATEPGQRLPTGRVTITGTITSIRDEPNHHAYNATTWKTLITAPAGWRVWMTLPGHLIQTAMAEQDQARQANTGGPFVPWTHYLEGRTITVTVTVKPSGKDPQFGFGKSPTKAVLGPPITETAPPGSAPQPSPAATQDPAVLDRTRQPQESIEDLPPEPPRPHVPAGQDGTQARTEEGTDEATGPAQPAPEHLDTSGTAAAPAASAPQGPDRGPADTADWTHGFTPREQAIIRIAVDDRAGVYFNSPIGGRQTAIRYTVEGPLRDLCDRHGYRRMCEAVDAYLDANPHALDHSFTHAEQAARDADRARQDDDLQAQALDAYRAGDYGLALALIDQAEQINPVGDHHDRIRDRIRVTTAQAAATTDPPPVQPDRASLDRALPPQELGEDLPPVSPGPTAAAPGPARQDGNQTGADSTDEAAGAIEAAPSSPGPELGVPAAAPALSTVVQSLINHAFHSGFTPLIGDPDPDCDGEFTVSLLDSSGDSALLLVVSGDQDQMTLHGLPDCEIDGWTSEVIPPTDPDAIRDAITDHAARLWPSTTPEASGRAEAGAASTGHHEPSPGVDAQSVPTRTAPSAAGGPDNAPQPVQPSPADGATAAAPEPSATHAADDVEPPGSPQPVEEEQLLLLSPWQIASAPGTKPHDQGEAAEEPRRAGRASGTPDPVDPGAGTGPHARGLAHLDHVAEEGEREQPERQASDDDLVTRPPSRLAADPAPASPRFGQGPLAEALQTVRDMVPRADQVLLTTSGPDDAGFVLRDVVLVDGASLAATDPDLLVEVSETCGHALSRLARNADVGEDSQGNAALQLNAPIRGPEPAPTDAETAAGLHAAASDPTADGSPTPDPAGADPIAPPATTSPQQLLPIDPAASTASPAQTPSRPHLDEEITMPAPSQDAVAQVMDDEPSTATSRAGGRSEPELARPRQATPVPTAMPAGPADDRTPVAKDWETELLRHLDADDPASAIDAMAEDLDFLDTLDDIDPDQPQTSPAPDRAAHDLSKQPVEGRVVRATDPHAANLEPPAPAAAAAGEARARIGRSYAAVDAGLRQLQSEIAAAKEALDQALDARPR
ncbi:MAG TPA: hypothetical protein VFP72_19600, partial [Kineosporiaceae bacterium]|nr:hypothetical protein [Kineosporiaceae bacterium]